MPAQRVILEPVGRNTAPAIAIAALYAMQENQGQDSTLLVVHSDAIITDVAKFVAAVTDAKKLAAKDYLICLGVTPNSPEIGYGYIKFGKIIDEQCNAYFVDKFVEKPSLRAAEEYVLSKQYLWNAGMFVFKASAFLGELNLYAADILLACQNVLRKSSTSAGALTLNSEEFSKCRSESIDYAVMEKTKSAVTIPLNVTWCDLGSWLSLWEYLQKDSNQNVIIGTNVKVDNVKDSYICSTGRKVVVLGMDDCVVVETPDAVLLMKKDQHQELKKIVENFERK